MVEPVYILRDGHGNVAFEKDLPVTHCKKNFWVRCKKFAKRSKVVSNLIEGSLHVDVMLRHMHTPKNMGQCCNPSAQNILSLLDSGDNSDVSFKVDDTIIPAHKLILQTNAPMLAGFLKDHEEGVPIEIEAVSPDVFRRVLRYIYGGIALDPRRRMTKRERGRLGMEIIGAADRFCLVELKVAIEYLLVASCTIYTDNVADILLFADAKTCPLLKEHAISFFVARAKDVLNSKWSDKLKESPRLLQELILAATHSQSYASNAVSDMSVSELREELRKRRLDVDGSKEILVSRLEGAKKRQRTE